jgi:hypothetical protein
MFHGHIITLASAENTLKLNLTTTDANPIQLDDPAGGVEETKDEDPDAIVVVKDSLHWMAEGYQSQLSVCVCCPPPFAPHPTQYQTTNQF